MIPFSYQIMTVWRHQNETLRLAIKRNVSRTLLFHSVIFPSDLWLLTSCQYKVIGIGIKFQMKKKMKILLSEDQRKKISWIQNSKWRAHIFLYAMWVLLHKWMNHLNVILINLINAVTSNASEAMISMFMFLYQF